MQWKFYWNGYILLSKLLCFDRECILKLFKSVFCNPFLRDQQIVHIIAPSQLHREQKCGLFGGELSGSKNVDCLWIPEDQIGKHRFWCLDMQVLVCIWECSSVQHGCVNLWLHGNWATMVLGMALLRGFHTCSRSPAYFVHRPPFVLCFPFTLPLPSLREQVSIPPQGLLWVKSLGPWPFQLWLLTPPPPTVQEAPCIASIFSAMHR